MLQLRSLLTSSLLLWSAAAPASAQFQRHAKKDLSGTLKKVVHKVDDAVDLKISVQKREPGLLDLGSLAGSSGGLLKPVTGIPGGDIGGIVSQYNGLLPADALQAVSSAVNPLLSLPLVGPIIEEVVQNSVSHLNLESTQDVLATVKSLTACIVTSVQSRNLRARCFTADGLVSQDLLGLKSELDGILAKSRGVLTLAQATQVQNIITFFLALAHNDHLTSAASLRSVTDTIDALIRRASILDGAEGQLAGLTSVKSLLAKLVASSSVLRKRLLLTDVAPIISQYKGIIPANVLSDIQSRLGPLTLVTSLVTKLASTVNTIVAPKLHTLSPAAVPAVGDLIRCLEKGLKEHSTATLSCVSLPKLTGELATLKTKIDALVAKTGLAGADKLALNNILAYAFASGLQNKLNAKAILANVVSLVTNFGSLHSSAIVKGQLNKLTGSLAGLA